MGAKLTPKVILEGTRLTFKTDIAFALNEHPRIVGPRKYRYHSPLISAEWCAFTNFPWGRGLINFEPHEAAQALETYQTWARLFELQRYYSWIVDRFHLSTQMYQLRTYGTYYDFRWLEDRAAPQLSPGLLHPQPRVLCRRPPGAAQGVGQSIPVRRPGAVCRGADLAAAAGERVTSPYAHRGHLRQRRAAGGREDCRLAGGHGWVMDALTPSWLTTRLE